MVMILSCLSAMLTLGGGAMALYGADIIRSESGLALAGSGVTMTCAGLVLLGITCVFAEMRRMRRLMEAEEILPPVAVAVQHQPPMSSAMPTPPLPAAHTPAAPTPGPAMPAPPAAAAPPAVDAAKSPEPAREPPHAAPAAAPPPLAASTVARTAAPPPPVMPPPLDVSERPRPAGSGIPAEAMASLAGSAAMLKGGRGGAGRGEASLDSPGPGLASGGEPVEIPARVEPVLPASAEGAPSEQPMDGTKGVPADGAFDLPPDTGPRTMLATYNSGGITYFMYSDSSIEADMTGGRYRFASMDELRTFIETGKGGALVTPANAPAAAEPENV